MSIIFDALKKTEALRRRGQSPDLHSSPQAGPPARGTNLRRWVLLAVFLLSAMATGVSLWRQRLNAVLETSSGKAPASGVAQLGDVRAADGAIPPTAVPSIPPMSAAEAGLPTVDLTRASAAAGAGLPAGIDSGSSPNASNSYASGEIPRMAKPLTGTVEFAQNAASERAAVVAEQARQREQMQAAELAQNQARMAQAAQQAQVPSAAQAQTPTPAEAQNSMQNAGQNQGQNPVGPASVVPPPTPSPASVPAAGLPLVYELDYQIRHDLPKMNVSMHVYNAVASGRFAMINGKRLGEGDQIEGGVSIVQIRPDGIECDFRGTRFFLPRGN
jgi:general secretion pathway protein B